MPSILDLPSIQLSQTINASLNLVWECSVSKSVLAHITSVSSLTGVWEGTIEDLSKPEITEATADWFSLASAIINGTAVTPALPGATITPADDDELWADTQGARYARFRRTGGSGTANIAKSNNDLQNIMAAAGIGDVVSLSNAITDDNAFTPATSKVIPIGFFADETAPDSVNEGDMGAARMTLDRFQKQTNEVEVGSIRYNGVEYPLVSVDIDTATSGNNALVAADASNKIAVVHYELFASSTNAVYFNDGTANLLGGTRKINMDATGSTGAIGVVAGSGAFILFETAAVNRPLNLNLGSANGIAGLLIYFKHP